jgi:quercetin dioxygenase-like cupin family protein
MQSKTSYLIVVLAIYGAFWSLDPKAFALEHGEGEAKHRMIRPGELEWKPGPDSLPRGSEYVILEGDPGKEGPFTMRLKVPSNYRIPPHTHPTTERVTVLSGELKLGMGTRYQEEAMEILPAGSFFTMPPGMQHYAGTDTETIIQLNGFGPWGIIYINPADDPRR